MKRFDYYQRLSPAHRRVYDESDRIEEFRLPDAPSLAPLVQALRAELERADRPGVQRAAAVLANRIAASLGADALEVRVLTRRPQSRESELHGLYEREPGKRALIRVWMRTAAHRRVAAFRTFLRTLLHEVCHHLDYTLLGFPESFHTLGFFRRESSLVRQVAGAKEPAARPRHIREPNRQIELFPRST